MRDIITKLEELNVEKEQLNEGLADMAHEAEKDHEVQMARSDCYKSAKYAVAIHKMLKDVSEMEGIDGWVAAKITKAADYLGSVKHYMEGQAMDDVELAVVPVAGDMTDAMTMPEESVEEGFKIRDKSRGYGVADKTYATRAEAEKARLLKMAQTGGDWEVIKEAVISEDREVMVRATNIDYDGPALDKLPTDVNVKVMVNPGDSEDEIFDMVADELEDRYGVKVSGFDMKMMEDQDIEEDEDVIGDIKGKLEKMGIPQKPKTSGMALPKSKPAEPIGSDPETGATRGLPPEQVYSPQQLQQIANQNRITKPALKKESKFADWSKK